MTALIGSVLPGKGLNMKMEFDEQGILQRG